MSLVSSHRVALPVALALISATVAAQATIFAPNPLTTIFEGADLSDKADPKCEVRLAGARGGAFSGQVVLYSTEAIAGQEARASDLKSADGKHVIPSSAIAVRYALPTGVNGIQRLPPGVTGIFDALDVKPRAGGQVHPVWVTVNVPLDAAAGDYAGSLQVAGREVPLRLSVAAWSLPPPADFVTWADFAQSPESVAMHYGVKFWSEEHWRLLEKSFEQLAKVGNKTIYIPLMCQTHFGNSETMVRWIKGEKERQFSHDFAIAEKYLDLYLKHAGKPSVVMLYIYEGFLGGSQGKTPEECERGVPFTQFDPKTGEVTTAAGPTHNNANPAYPNYPDDTIAFWKPVIDGMRERLQERGIGDEAIMLGMSPDLAPGKLQMEYLARTFPYARWCKQGHGLQAGKMGPMPIGYNTTVWQAAFAKTPEDRLYGWKQYKIPVAMFDRDIWKPVYSKQLVRSRLLGEMNISGKQRGFGRMSADFWPVLKSKRGKAALVNRYPLSNWAQLSLRMTPYLYPGADGALATTRFEMLREGVQECEARIFIEKVLLDKEARLKLGEPLALRVQNILDERVAAIIAAADFVAGPWQERSRRLFEAAAAVARRLK